MAKTATIHVRMDEQLKEDALKVFDELGLSTAEAVTLYFKQVALKRAIPFSLDAEAVVPPANNLERVNAFRRDDLARILEVLPDSVEELWVFGSAATPFCRPDSDLNVCVVGRGITMAEKRQMFNAPHCPVDLLDATPEEFAEDREEFGSVFHEVYHKGLLIYRKGEGLIDG